ncbi:MAG: hypothetical protein ABR986_00490 [Methanomassiliicoccales archaeon]|jgi:hypothetical protein
MRDCATAIRNLFYIEYRWAFRQIKIARILLAFILVVGLLTLPLKWNESRNGWMMGHIDPE